MKTLKETMIFVETDGFSWIWLTKCSKWTFAQTQHSAHKNGEHISADEMNYILSKFCFGTQEGRK